MATALPTLPYTAPRAYSTTYGGIPEVPDPTEAAAKAARGTLESAPDITALGRRFNRYFENQLASRIPGYNDMVAQSAGNIGSALRGEVPQDVINLLGQQAAERGIARGVSGSQLANTDYLRALGLTSLGQQQYGEQALTGALGRAESVPVFDVGRYAVGPEQMQTAAMMANVYGAAPEPASAGRAGIAAFKAGQGGNAWGAGGGTPPIVQGGGGPSKGPVAPTGGMNISGVWGQPAWSGTTRNVTGPSLWSTGPTGQFSWAGGAGVPSASPVYDQPGLGEAMYNPWLDQSYNPYATEPAAVDFGQDPLLWGLDDSGAGSVDFSQDPLLWGLE